MAEGGLSLILCILKNSYEMPNNYLFKVSNKDTSLIWAKYSKLAVMPLEQYQQFSGIFIANCANCEHISQIALVFLLLASNRYCLIVQQNPCYNYRKFNKIHIIIIGKFNKIHVIIIIQNNYLK